MGQVRAADRELDAVNAGQYDAVADDARRKRAGGHQDGRGRRCHILCIHALQALVRQGEQLRKVDTQLDDINASTVQTQRNLNNIKSVFGGIKNYFS